MDIWENKNIVYGTCLDIAHKNLPPLFKNVINSISKQLVNFPGKMFTSYILHMWPLILQYIYKCTPLNKCLINCHTN